MKKILIFVSFAFLFSLPVFSQSWNGEWVKNKQYSVTITNATATSFHYVFDCFNGTNFGQAEGDAYVGQNDGYSKPEEPGVCQIHFMLKGNYIIVEDIRIDNCSVDAGNGVYYAGKYMHKAPKKTKTKKK